MKERPSRWKGSRKLLVILGLPAGPLDAQAPDWRAMLAATAVEVRVRDSTVQVALAGDSIQVTLALPPAGLRRFAEGATRMLQPARLPASQVATQRVEEAGERSGSLTLTRSGTWVRLFAADDLLGGVRDTLSLNEARLLVRRLRMAAAAATPRARPRPRDNP